MSRGVQTPNYRLLPGLSSATKAFVIAGPTNSAWMCASEWIAAVCITRLIKAEAVSKGGAEFFIPLVCFNCVAGASPAADDEGETAEEKLGEIEEMSRRCFWDRLDKCQANRVPRLPPPTPHTHTHCASPRRLPQKEEMQCASLSSNLALAAIPLYGRRWCARVVRVQLCACCESFLQIFIVYPPFH